MGKRTKVPETSRRHIELRKMRESLANIEKLKKRQRRK